MPGNSLITRLGEYSLEWKQLRGRGATLVTADDTVLDLAASKGDWANKPSEPTAEGFSSLNCVPACTLNIPKLSAGKIRTVQIIGYGFHATPENKACAWILYAYRGRYSPAIRVGAGTALLGTMDVVTDPVENAALTAFYVDDWGITSTYWDSSIVEKDSAANGCSILQFPLRGFTYQYLQILPTSGTITSFGAAFSGF